MHPLAFAPLVLLEIATGGPTATLSWTAPADCPTKDAVLAGVAKELRETGPAVASVNAVGIAKPQSSGHAWGATLEVEVGDRKGARTLEADSCPAIADAAALIIAIAMQTGAAPPPPPPPPPPLSPPPRPPPAAPPAVVPRTDGRAVSSPPPKRPSGKSRLAVEVSGAGDVGTLPRTSAGVAGSIGWRYESGRLWTSVAATGSYFPGVFGSVTAVPGEGGNFTLGTAGGAACVGARVTSLELGPCAGGEIEIVQAAGQGEDKTKGGTGTFGAASLGLVAAYMPSSWIGVPLRVEALVPFVRPPFIIDEPDSPAREVHRPGPVSGRITVGIEVRFF